MIRQMSLPPAVLSRNAAAGTVTLRLGPLGAPHLKALRLVRCSGRRARWGSDCVQSWQPHSQDYDRYCSAQAGFSIGASWPGSQSVTAGHSGSVAADYSIGASDSRGGAAA